MIDTMKLVVAAIICIAGVYGYYELPSLLGQQEVSILLRVGVLMGALLLATAVALTSSQGAALIEFSKGARTELRKMVWPSRQETVQTTIIVLILVVVVAIFLWLVDMAVFEMIYDWLLGVED